MNGPRAVAESLASSYLAALDPHSPHPDNVRRFLRGPTLEATRRILAGEDDALEDDARRRGAGGGGGVGADGNGATPPGGGAAATSALGWRDYLDRQSSPSAGGNGSGGEAAPVDRAAPVDDSARGTAAAASAEGRRDDDGDVLRGGLDGDGDDVGGGGGAASTAPPLSRRSLARLDAFLTSCSLAVPDDPLPCPMALARERQRRSTAAAGGATSPIGSPNWPPSLGPIGAESPPRLVLAGGESKDGGHGAEAKGKAKGRAGRKGGSSASAATAAAAEKEARLTLSTALSGFKVHEETAAAAAAAASAFATSSEEKKEGQSSSALPPKPPKPQSFLPAAAAAPPPSAAPPPKTSILRRISSAASSASESSAAAVARKSRPLRRYPQVDRADLSVRLELYLRSLRRARDSPDECVVHLEPSRAVRARVDAAVRSFVATVGCVRSMAPVLTSLLSAMTRELLAVEVLSDGLTEKISRAVSEYEHMTSFASLAFLSTPEESGRAHLTPLLRTYVSYLQSEWRDLVSACELERTLGLAVDPAVRATFKTVEFRSIGHLLDVCREHRPHLERIRLPRTEEADIMAQCSDPKVVRQALRDLRREIITVNGHVLPPAHSLKELVKLLTETLNSRPLTLVHHGGGGGGAGGGGSGRRRTKRGGERKSSSGMRRIKSSPAVSSRSGASSSESEAEAIADAEDDDGMMASVASESDLSSGNEGDTDGTPRGRADSGGGGSLRDRFRREGSGSSGLSRGSSSTSSSSTSSSSQRRGGRGRVRARSFDLSAIDMMTRRLLVAASRTGTGGDAYFVVRDLFGGDDVEVLPSKVQPTYASSVAGVPLRTAIAGGGTIELIVRLASVTIRCHGTYDVYPKALVGECEPLIQLHATTTETVSLHEVRAGGDGSGSGNGGDTGGGREGTAAPRPSADRAEFSPSAAAPAPPATTASPAATVLMLKERTTDATGERTLSIRPASYERVHVLNTPS